MGQHAAVARSTQHAARQCAAPCRPLHARDLLDGETRLFDATALLRGSAFEALRDETAFANPSIEKGVCTWSDGDLDVAPEFMYENSFPYEMIA